jgi:glycosyltransferase involved in cell wall biosynthesis
MDRIGGNLRTLFYILNHLERSLFELVVVSPMHTEFVQRVRDTGSECLVIEPPASAARYGGKALREGPLGRLRTAFDLIRYNLRLARFMRERRFDVIYANSIRAVLFVALAARLTRTPLLWYIKGELNNRWLDWLGFVVSDRILFFCEANRDDKYPSLVRKHAAKIGILRIGIDPAALAEVEKRDKTRIIRDLGIDPGRVNTIVLAQLYRPKGQHFAIEALASLVSDHPELKLYIVGDHVIEEYRGYRDELDALVSRHGLTEHVVFTGWRSDALDILAAMDIVLHPSLSEGFGRAVLESMALGKPVVASKVGGLREIIRHGENGFLVDPGDVDGIASAWRALVTQPALRASFARAARHEVFSRYLLADKIEQLGMLWREMAAKGSPRVRHRG